MAAPAAARRSRTPVPSAPRSSPPRDPSRTGAPPRCQAASASRDLGLNPRSFGRSKPRAVSCEPLPTCSASRRPCSASRRASCASCSASRSFSTSDIVLPVIRTGRDAHRWAGGAGDGRPTRRADTSRCRRLAPGRRPISSPDSALHSFCRHPQALRLPCAPRPPCRLPGPTASSLLAPARDNRPCSLSRVPARDSWAPRHPPWRPLRPVRHGLGGLRSGGLDADQGVSEGHTRPVGVCGEVLARRGWQRRRLRRRAAAAASRHARLLHPPASHIRCPPHLLPPLCQPATGAGGQELAPHRRSATAFAAGCATFFIEGSRLVLTDHGARLQASPSLEPPRTRQKKWLLVSAHCLLANARCP